jgi:3-mercaptopyruvate sulfurtransferase SseA
VALQLRKHGIKTVRPLLGGYQAWKDLGYPLQTVEMDEETAESQSAVATDGAV